MGPAPLIGRDVVKRFFREIILLTKIPGTTVTYPHHYGRSRNLAAGNQLRDFLLHFPCNTGKRVIFVKKILSVSHIHHRIPTACIISFRQPNINDKRNTLARHADGISLYRAKFHCWYIGHDARKIHCINFRHND